MNLSGLDLGIIAGYLVLSLGIGFWIARRASRNIYYGLILTVITMLYVVKGGMYSVVITEVVQFVIMTVACIAIGVLAMQQVSAEMLAKAAPDGLDELSFGW